VEQSLDRNPQRNETAAGQSCPFGGLDTRMGIIWTIIIGFIAGVIAKFIMPGPNEPQGFILTTILGVVGAFVATFLGQALGWYRAGEGAGFIGAIVGAVIVLAIWGFMQNRRTPV
jgi:uncharacterized membrane protein YeaQ/YmgE (transglycosylase-associated protein family)